MKESVGVEFSSRPNHADQRALRILVVEDEALLRWAISESLAAAGHVVVAAEDGAAALQVLESASGDVDAVLLDFRLPDSNDLGLLQRVRALRPELAVVMMTACSTPELTRDALELGAFRVVDKPFEMPAIEACLRDAYAARGRR